MNPVVIRKTYEAPIFCNREILRYAGCRDADAEITTLLESCVKEAADKLTYKVCYCELPVTIHDAICDFTVFHVRSAQLASNLHHCVRVVLFAATIGIDLDRLIAKYSRLSPAKALMLQAIGAERIEALCDRFCEDTANALHTGLRPRFSPGYGDLPLTVQKNIFSVLDCGKQIGLTLNDSLLMSPTKSVTAFVGLGSEKNMPHNNRCSV